MSAYELAQLNIGIARAPMDSPVMAEFAANLARINAIADASPGFVWRLQTEAGNATGIRAFDDERMLVNMSVWRDLDSLKAYVYRSDHAAIMRRRRDWFEPMDQAFVVLWWVPAGHRPSVAEARHRLERLRTAGPTDEAFTFRDAFAAPDAAPHLAGTHLRLRPDARIEPLAVDATFWQRVAAGELGDFHDEYLVTMHTSTDRWPMWEMHPHGDEVVCLLSGSVDLRLEEPQGVREIALRSPGEFALIARGTWHTANPHGECRLLFITAGEGTLHRPAT